MKVLITREIPQTGIRILEQYRELELVYLKGDPLSEEEMIKKIKDVAAIIPVIPDKINKKVINAGKNLKVIATYSVGYDHVDLDAATNKNVYVANTPGDLTESVAEHAAALMLSLGRRIAEADKFCRKGQYKFWDPLAFIGPEFLGKTIGIIGFGRIGQKFARICKYGFNMEVIYYDVMDHPEAASLLDAKRVTFDELLSESDIISIHCNLSESTKHLIDTAQLELMKPDVLLINTSRGPVIDEKALHRALKEKYIAGAALDVFEEEPDIHSGLKILDNVILTPHIASATWEARIQMARMAAENVVDVLINNKPPRYIVNKELIKESTSSIV
jgi:glyoxylate reductase